MNLTKTTFLVESRKNPLGAVALVALVVIKLLQEIGK